MAFLKIKMAPTEGGLFYGWPLTPTRLERAYDTLAGVAVELGLTHPAIRVWPSSKRCKPIRNLIYIQIERQ
jgi:hypothetical protein